jgi:hypothetical protein
MLVLKVRRGNLWAPASPNLNPCDLFLWGYLKELVYKPLPANLAPPHQATAAQAVPPPAEQAQPPPHEDPQHAAAEQAGHLPVEQAQFPPQLPQVCDSVCPDYEALPAVQVATHHLPLHQVSPLIHQQDRRLTLKISLRTSLLRRYGL